MADGASVDFRVIRQIVLHIAVSEAPEVPGNAVLSWNRPQFCICVFIVKWYSAACFGTCILRCLGP